MSFAKGHLCGALGAGVGPGGGGVREGTLVMVCDLCFCYDFIAGWTLACALGSRAQSNCLKKK